MKRSCVRRLVLGVGLESGVRPQSGDTGPLWEEPSPRRSWNDGWNAVLVQGFRQSATSLPLVPLVLVLSLKR